MEETSKNRAVLKFVIFILVLLCAGIAAYRMGLHRFFSSEENLVAYIESFGSASAPVFIGFQILQVLFAPVPGEVSGFVGGYLYGGVMGLIYSTVGLSAGSIAAFLLSRIFGRPLVEKVARSETLEKYDFLMEHKGVWISFLLFLIPGFPKDIFCYMLGTSHMRLGVFVLISTTGRLLGTSMLSVSGSLARGGEFRLLGLVAVAAAGLAFISYLYRQRLVTWLRLRRKRRSHDHGD